jgi:serine phosphatase RsbU (regulator of sigma subunit)
MSEKDLATGNGRAADPDREARQECSVADTELAARIHYSMIPDGFQNGFFDIDVKLIPCQKVGGDYCSIIPRGEKQLNVNICDVMGHGTASALLAARINSYILTWTMHMNHPCEIIESLNDFLFENFSQYNIFSTFFLSFSTCKRGSSSTPAPVIPRPSTIIMLPGKPPSSNRERSFSAYSNP